MSRLARLPSRLSAAPSRRLAPVGERRNAWGAGRGGRPWRRLREKIIFRDCYTCRSCGVVTDAPEVDHIINVAQGGTDDESNLQTLCASCHKKKTARESAAGMA